MNQNNNQSAAIDAIQPASAISENPTVGNYTSDGVIQGSSDRAN